MITSYLKIGRGTAAWIEVAAAVSESLCAGFRHFLTGFRGSGLATAILMAELERYRVLYYRLMRDECGESDLIELFLCAGLVPAASKAFDRAQQIQNCLFERI